MMTVFALLAVLSALCLLSIALSRRPGTWPYYAERSEDLPRRSWMLFLFALGIAIAVGGLILLGVWA